MTSHYGSFILPETNSGTDSDSDSKLHGYTALYTYNKTCSHCTDSDSDPYSISAWDRKPSLSPYPIPSPAM